MVSSTQFSLGLCRYRKAVNTYASHQSTSFEAAFHGDAAILKTELARIESERVEILQLLSPEHHKKLVDKGLKRLSFDATIAALMIHMLVFLSHNRPLLVHPPTHLCHIHALLCIRLVFADFV
jgi:hypothetical protein